GRVFLLVLATCVFVLVRVTTYTAFPLHFSPTMSSFSKSTLFPYTTLFRSPFPYRQRLRLHSISEYLLRLFEDQYTFQQLALADIDRKSTRLNSSHVSISYAVFCLNKNRSNCYRPTISE